jgi:tetratricopeptide (TPR) repeat protein
MVKHYLIRLLYWLLGESGEPPPPPQPSARAPLNVALQECQQALDALSDDPQTLLPVLLARDQVETALGQTQPLPLKDARHLVDLDDKLRRGVSPPAMKELPAWRQTFGAPDARWWWFLDQKAEAREKENDLPWVLLSGTFVLLTASLTAEILTRLWDGAPDLISIFGTLLTLTLTTSPLVKRGPDLAAWTLRRIPRLELRHHAEALVALTGLALAVVLAIRLLLVPLALFYNNEGFDALQDGNLSRARQKFQRAVALDPDQVVAAYNLAEIYWRTNRLDEAQTWYQQAIERDLNFPSAYRGLGHVHNQQEQYQEAEAVLLAGLTAVGDAPAEKAEVIVRYELLAHLGWAYFAQDKAAFAQRALEEAIAWESQLQVFESAETPRAKYRVALPHYYLAQIYEQSERLQDALTQWNKCLSLLEPGWAQQEWRVTAQEHSAQLEDELQ